MGYRNYANTNGFIVSKNGTGDFTTIATALTAATSGTNIFISPGTYTENPTLKAGVNLIAYPSDDLDAQVVIAGKCSASFAGTCDITGIQLQTNSDFALAVTGANVTNVNLVNCYINCTNTTGISNTGSNAASTINVYDAIMNLGTTGIAYFSGTNGVLGFYSCVGNNTGSSLTANTFSGASLTFKKCYIGNTTTTSGSTCIFLSDSNYYATSSVNVTAINSNSTVASPATISNNDYFSTGTAVPMTVGASSTLFCTNCATYSSNSALVTGSGSFTYAYIAQTNTIGTLSATTLVSKGSIGNQTATASPAGYIGELISADNTSGTSMSINAVTNISSIALTPGIWDINGNITLTYTTGVGILNTQGCLSTTSTTFSNADGVTGGMCTNVVYSTTATGGGAGDIVFMGPGRVLVSANTNYYINAYLAGTSASSIVGKGYIRATRVA
jgi:hypothetical protein